jgi:beta-carotene ketolase (CrtO type)
MGSPYDAVVIGARHNGLVCAAYLAKAGLRVAVVECAPRAGGCIAVEQPEGLPGYTLDVGGLDRP